MEVIDAGTDNGQIADLLAPFLYVVEFTSQFISPHLSSLPPYGIVAYVKADEEIHRLSPVGTPPRQVRSLLMARAEDALDALEAAGWHLTDYPAMEITGEICHFVQTLDGVLLEPSQQFGIGLKMRFRVDRPR